MKHLWRDTMFGLRVSSSTLLEQAIYHSRDASLICKVKRSHIFAITSAYIRSSYQQKLENIERVSLCSEV
jgi:hypothetical protein